ncbi:MAG TPA: hypothetical protein VE553_02675, partial [Candidatus Binatia bacterium]|nr:hypothetical protein [Candidatus Binatia bacterium]
MPLPQDNPDLVAAGNQEQELRERGALETSARKLAEEHTLVTQKGEGGTRRVFMQRLEQQEALLQRAYESFLRASQEEPVLSYAAEWYLDNYYLLQRVHKQILEDFPARYYLELPKIAADGPLDGYPRVFDMARQLIVLDRCEVDEQRIRRFVTAYQEVQPLRIGELWALPIMLRVVLLESIVQAALDHGVPDREAEAPAAFQLPYEQAGEEIISTCIPSLRSIDEENWKEFFESVSLADQVLRSEPTHIYSQMDFETRDQYRKRVEELAAGSSRDEVAVAKAAVGLARAYLGNAGAASKHNGNVEAGGGLRRQPARQAHVGYYLMGRGRQRLEREIAFRMGAASR